MTKQDADIIIADNYPKQEVRYIRYIILIGAYEYYIPANSLTIHVAEDGEVTEYKDP